MEWHDVIGVVGAGLIVLAYGLVQTEKMAADDRRWSAINLVGAGCLVVSLLLEFNLAAFLLEFFWLCLSIYGVLKPRRPGRDG
ncbi:MAG: hypothetical protein ACI9OJ_001266 [Myxococcota bacterium]|jgi:hypothetical protein